MGCCHSREDVIPDAAGGVAPNSSRKCRDVLCCVVFLVFWLGMAILAIVGVANGTPQRLLYGTDFTGQVCGTGTNATASLIYYPRINDDMTTQAAKGVPPLDMKFYGLCVTKCPVVGDYICAYAAEAAIQTANPGASAATLAAARQARANVNPLLYTPDCWLVSLPSDAVAFRCLPTQVVNSNTTQVCLIPGDAPQYYTVTNGVKTPNAKCSLKATTVNSQTVGEANSNPVFDQLQTTGALIGRYVSDVKKTYGELLGIGGGGALVLGWLFLFFMRCCAGCVIWSVLFAVVLLLGILSTYFLFKGGLIQSDAVDQVTNAIQTATSVAVQVPASLTQAQNNIRAFQAAAVICLFLTLVAILIVCFMRKRIKIAIGIIREASRAIQRLPLLIAFPVIPVVFLVVLFIYTTVIGAYIYSADGNISLNGVGALSSVAPGNATAMWSSQLSATTSAVQPKQLMEIMIAYHLFGFLWTNQLIQAVSMTTIAGAVCKYYWSRDKSVAEMGRFPILAAFKNCFRYHFGSLAVGSFIIALVQFIRMVLMYIDHQTKQLQQSNVAVKIALKVVACCLWCLEKCLKFISKNAYILIAMKGRSFCASTREAFSLIFANMAQVAITATIVNLIVVVARVTISVACALLLFLYLDKSAAFEIGGARELSSVFPPVLLGWILAWFVSGAFLGVYEMTVDTILLCFCEDRRINKENGHYYMSKELEKFVDKVAKKAKADEGMPSAASPSPMAKTQKIEVSPKSSPKTSPIATAKPDI
ncbi:Aste57867_9620 [Aphanomyces stellatus]|uniref:Choline transporter-like protein n=1 Tax=Aphanomyces stellatus TaxID=120398 RepID=A0A485KN96_9STRA|nr:hypothetical protein As57867_009582 [Aphanomyces stellatus]VFT86499.1 Aste57867_9620 [Aphanomyces stellatus]